MAATVMVACGVEDGGGDRDDVIDRVGPPPILAVADTVCVPWRQVVRRTAEGNCAPVDTTEGSWIGTKLFPGWSGPHAKYGAYCVYEFSNPGAVTPQHVGTLHGKTWVAEAAADCAVVVPETTYSTLENEINPALDALADDRIDLLTDAELGLPATENARAAVQISVLDTVPAAWNQPRDNHGVFIADLISEVAHACVNANCRVQVRNSLALPRYGLGPNDKDAVRGGMRAFQSEIAAALYQTIRTWETAGMSSKLVLNMSFGWLAAFGQDPAASSPAVDAVLLALRRSSCEGALAIAAAGNEKDDCTPGPMLPAAWEQLSAPSVNQCTSVLDVANPVGSNVPYRPLVYAAGGVGWDDSAVSSARVGGRPRIAAIASHMPRLGLPASSRTGSSIAAAITSGIAGLVWSYNGNLDAHQVMDMVFRSGVATGDQADFSLFGSQEIRRVTACAALEEACDATNACPNAVTPSCTAEDAWLDDAQLVAAIDGADPGTVVAPAMTLVGECPRHCGETHDLWVMQGANQPACPATTEADLQALAAPQPTNMACPDCTWKPGLNYSVSIVASLASTWATSTDVGMSVTLVYANGKVVTYNLGDQNLTTATKTIPVPSTVQSTVVSGTVSIWFNSLSSAPIVGDLVVP